MNPDIPSPGLPEHRTPLTSEEMREKIRDPNFLPSYRDLENIFRQYRGRYAASDDDPEWKQWGALVSNSENPIFEFWTKEYIHAFGEYLAKRVEELSGTAEHPTIMLEIGAGNGRLAHFLQEKLNELVPGRARVVPTDSGVRKITSDFPIETIPHHEALVKYKPTIILFSWMPCGEDFTADFRAADSVEEYILIGEADSGMSGDEWKTWGIPDAWDEEEKKRLEHEPAPFEVDGFEKKYLDDISAFQLSRLNVIEGSSSNTQTVSFKKGKADH